MCPCHRVLGSPRKQAQGWVGYLGWRGARLQQSLSRSSGTQGAQAPAGVQILAFARRVTLCFLAVERCIFELPVTSVTVSKLSAVLNLPFLVEYLQQKRSQGSSVQQSELALELNADASARFPSMGLASFPVCMQRLHFTLAAHLAEKPKADAAEAPCFM